jgi:hypothetical protein
MISNERERPVGKAEKKNLASSEQEAETFLAKVMVVCQHVRNAMFAHDAHRDAIGQAVAFIKTRLIERHSRQETFGVDGVTSTNLFSSISSTSAAALRLASSPRSAK